MDNMTDGQISDLLQQDQNMGEKRPQDAKHLQFTEDLTESKVLEKVKKYETQWAKYSPTYEKNLKTAINAYKNQQVTVDKVTVKIPEIFTLIETELPHLLNSIFGQSLIVDAVPKFNDPDESRTYKIKNYINRIIKDNCNGRKKSEALIKNMLIYGTSVIKAYWDIETEKDVNPVDGSLIDINSSHANFDLVDPWTWAWDLNNESHDVSNCQWLRERIYISKDKLKVMRDNEECGWFDDDEMAFTENKGKKERQKGSTTEDTNEGNTYYDEYSTTLYSEDAQGKTIANEYIVWVLGKDKIIKFIPNPQGQKMYMVTRAYENPNEFMGLGEPDVIGALSAQLSYVHYQMGKLALKIGQHLTVITPQAGITKENLRRAEGGVIMVDSMDAIDFEKQMDANDVQVLMKVKEYLDNQIESVTGIGKALSGESIGDVTATEASYVFQNASNRLALKLTHLQEDFLKELAEKFFLLSKQLMTEPVQFFDQNNNLQSLQPTDFLGTYDWSATGSITAANKALMLQQNTQLIQQVIQLTQASAQTQKPLTWDGLVMLQTLIAPNISVPDMGKFVYPVQQEQEQASQQQGITGPMPQQGAMGGPGVAPAPNAATNAFAPGPPIQQPNKSILMGDIEKGVSTLKAPHPAGPGR